MVGLMTTKNEFLFLHIYVDSENKSCQRNLWLRY